MTLSVNNWLISHLWEFCLLFAIIRQHPNYYSNNVLLPSLPRPSRYIYLIVCRMFLTVGSHRPARTIQASNGYITRGRGIKWCIRFHSFLSDSSAESRFRQFYFCLVTVHRTAPAEGVRRVCRTITANCTSASQWIYEACVSNSFFANSKFRSFQWG